MKDSKDEEEVIVLVKVKFGRKVRVASAFLFTRCAILYNTVFEIPKKVSFNIASEASYVYILSGQKLLKNSILASFWKPEICVQIVLPDSIQCYQTGKF